MADLDPDVIRQVEEELKKLEERFGITIGNLKSFGEAAIKGSSEFKKELVKLSKQIEKGRAGYADQLRVLESLNDSIEDAIKQKKSETEVNKLLQQKKELLEKAAYQNTREQLQHFGTELGKATVSGTGKFVRGLQDGVAATQLTNTVLNAGIDVAAAGISAAGSAATGFGAVMMNAKNPVVAGIGVLVSGLGYAGKAAAEAGKELAKFAVDIVSKEIEKTVKAFHDISIGGAVFADGMEGMRDAAKGSMLTLEDFSAVVQRQSANLGASGLSVPAAVKKMGGALTAGGDSMRKNLQNLGFRIEEHGDLVAQTMVQMRQSGGPLMASNTVVAEQTQKYAENLRVIAALTGEDAQTRAKAAQEQANQLMFQQKLASLSETQRAGVMNAYNAADAVTRKNFMDLVNFGSVINDQGAILTAQLPAQREKQDRMFALYNQRMLDEVSFRQIQKDTNGKIRQQLTDEYGVMSGIAAVQASGMGGEIAGVAQLGMDILKEVAPDADAITTAEKLVHAQMKTTNQLTSDMNDAAKAAKNLAIQMQEILLPYMKEYAGYSKTILETFKDYVSKTTSKPSTMAADLKKDNMMSEALTGKTSAGEKVGFFEQWFNTIGASQGIPGQAAIDATKGKALGGISTGPISGYSETLHGTEAVVPLADNRSIPVSLDSSSITAAVHQQTGVLSEILRAMQNNNSLTSQIAMNTV